MRPYAEGTTVAPEQSRAEIEKLLTRYGAISFASGWMNNRAAILFEHGGRRVRFELPMPDERFPMGAKRDAEIRRRWRCMVLSIKSKLEMVQTGIASFEEEFLAHIVVPGSDETFVEWAGPRLAEAYRRGTNMPPLLGVGGASQ